MGLIRQHVNNPELILSCIALHSVLILLTNASSKIIKNRYRQIELYFQISSPNTRTNNLLLLRKPHFAFSLFIFFFCQTEKENDKNWRLRQAPRIWLKKFVFFRINQDRQPVYKTRLGDRFFRSKSRQVFLRA